MYIFPRGKFSQAGLKVRKCVTYSVLTRQELSTQREGPYAPWCQRGGVSLYYAKNMVQFWRTGRGLVGMERKLWLGGGRVGGVGNIFFFFQKQSQKWTGKSGRDWKTVIESLPVPDLPKIRQAENAWFRIGSYSTYEEGEITQPPVPSWQAQRPPALFSSSAEQLYWLQLRKFIQREWCLPTSQGRRGSNENKSVMAFTMPGRLS